MNQVSKHVVFRSCDFFLARVVEMNERIVLSTDCEAAAGAVVNLNRVAIVDFQRNGKRKSPGKAKTRATVSTNSLPFGSGRRRSKLQISTILDA